MTPQSESLQLKDSRSLAELETVIEHGIATFVEVGQALLEIRERRLYRELGYRTFEDYCREKWEFSHQRASQMIEAAHVAVSLATVVAKPEEEPETVLPMGNTAFVLSPLPLPPPTSERQARELAKVKDVDERRAVWQAARTQHGEKVTARDIAETRIERAAAHGDAEAIAMLRRPPVPLGPTPRQEASAAAGHQWAEIWRKLIAIVSTANDAGGFDALFHRWSYDDRHASLAEIRRLISVMHQWEDALEDMELENG